MFTPHAVAPDPATLGLLCRILEGRSPETARVGPWQSGCFELLARHGCLAGFLPLDVGGNAATEPALVTTLAAIAQACLTTALALSQWAAACRIIDKGDVTTRLTWLPPLARGEAFTTVGISQLTTSRRHLGKAAITASEHATGWCLDGECPWVTGADSVDTIVTGAATADGSRRFFVVETTADGLDVAPPLALLALTGSRTSAVRCTNVRPAAVIAPADGDGGRTGGLATTALALGATRASVAIVTAEAGRRADLMPIARQLTGDAARLAARLDEAARAGIGWEDRDRLRADANSLVVRAAQTAVVACKGAGFVQGHPAERLVRESLFFLVWSCPQTVAQAAMCELANVS